MEIYIYIYILAGNPKYSFFSIFRFFMIFNVFWSIQIKRISPCFSSHRDLSIHAVTIPNERYKLYFWTFFCFFRKNVFCFWWFWCFLLLPFKSNVTIVLFTPKTCVHAKYELRRMLFRSFTDENTILIFVFFRKKVFGITGQSISPSTSKHWVPSC